jgi:protein-S-isoprenylcysteine O-methyltransferase Ste14
MFAAIFFLDTSPGLFAPGRVGIVGAVLCAMGLVIMFSAFASIRDAVQIAPEPRPGGKLVTDGIYKILRHPIYTAILILVVGLFFRKPTVRVAIAAAVVIAFLIVKSRFEEKLLLARYPEYAAYKTRTWGIIPAFGHRGGKISQDNDGSIK